MIEKMEPELLFTIVFTIGFIAAIIDSSLGMGYGSTTPLFFILGFSPIIVVPTVLLAQMLAGFSGTIFHQIFENVDITTKNKDTKITLLFALTGCLGMIFAVAIAVNIPEFFVLLYIGLMLIVVGFLLIIRISFKFSWKRLYLISGIGAFNKAFSGGGYGPITTLGQLMTKRKVEHSVAVTAFSEAFLSGFGFLLYFIFAQTFIINLPFLVVMSISGVIGTPIGALIASRLKKQKKLAKNLIGLISITIGLISIIRLFFI